MAKEQSTIDVLDGSSTDKTSDSSQEEFDLTTVQGLRQFQRSFILQQPSVQRLTDFFPETLASALRADTNLEWQLAALDALSIWILRATRSADPTNLALKITSSQWDSLLTLVWIRWSSAPNSNAIQKVLKELFSKTLVLQRILYPDWETREIDALKRVVTMTGVDMKIQCFLIEVLVRRAPEGARRVMEIHKGWVKEMLERMKDSSVGPAIGKCLVSVLMTRRTELIMEDPENGHSRWLETWKSPLLPLIGGSDEGHIRLLNKYFLPSLSRECPHAFADLLQSMAKDIIEKHQTTGLQAFVLCLNMARKNSSLHDDPLVAFTEMGLPSNFLYALLTNTSPTIRLAAFDLLTFHPHQKTPLSNSSYTLIQTILPILFADQDAEFRIEILRSLRNLILRIRASTHAASRELERTRSKLGNSAELDELLMVANHFVIGLIAFLRECLSPGRSYYISSMALKTLHYMAEEGFFPDMDVEVKSGVLSGVHIPLFSAGTVRLLLDRLADPYDEVARLAYGLIERVRAPEMLPWKTLFDIGKILCLSGRADKSEGGAKVLCLCQRFCEVNGYTNVWEEIWESIVVDVKTGNLRSVAMERPLHGRLVALRVDDNDIVKRVLQLCGDIWDLVSPILTHDSPEGNLHTLIATPVDAVGALRDASAQDLLSSSWRSLKEAAALLGTLLSSPTSTLEDYQAAGKLFMEWLSLIRHRGAFSAVMPAFENLCSECFKDKQKHLTALPAQWLNECISSMKVTSRSITRRSGGLPMLITALLVAEAQIQSYDLTKSALSQLIAIAETPIDITGIEDIEPAKWDLPQVHAQNTMRAIFTESKLATTSFAFIESGFGVAIKGFSADIFPIRNCSIMFFDALLSRALGQKYARQDIDPTAPNRSVSSKVFFSKFPKLYKYLLDQLERDVSLLEDNDDTVNTGLYPILTLISRLDVTRIYDAKKYIGMHPFHGLIQRCMASRIWKLRAMAARCLPTVMDPDFLSEEIATIFSGFRMDAQNELHGGLMGIKRLAEFYSFRALRGIVFDAIIVGMISVGEMVLQCNPNPLTKAAFVEIVRYLLENDVKADDLCEMTMRVCIEDLQTTDVPPVGWQMYLEQAALLLLEGMKTWNNNVGISAEEVVVQLLRNDNQEVLLTTLSWINDPKSETVLVPKIRRALRQLVLQDKWDGIRAMALQAMSRAMNDYDDGISLETCIQGFETGGVMPLKEGWIVVCGYSARMEYAKDVINEELLTRYFEILSASSLSEKPESTRLAALRSLQIFSSVLTSAIQTSSPPALLISPCLALLLFLSDDDFKIRHLASEITTSILGEYMLYTPMEASQKLAQVIGESFPPAPIKSLVMPLICNTKVHDALSTALDSAAILFAKERENIWRDEIHQCGLYTRILSLCLSRQMEAEDKSESDDVLVRWVIDALDAIKDAVQSKEDAVLGWSHDIDAFESVMKVFTVVSVLLRYGKAGDLLTPLGQLKEVMSRRSIHDVWKERVDGISGARVVSLD